MIPIRYTATYQGVTKPLAEWGFESSRLTTQNLAADQLILAGRVGDFRAGEIFATEEFVDIHLGDTRIYRGEVLPSAGATTGQQYNRCLLWGAFSELEQFQYLQYHALRAGAPSSMNGTPTGDSSAQYGRTIINRDSAFIVEADPDSGRIAVGDQVRRILQCAIDHGADLAIGTIDDGLYAPAEIMQDVTCAEALVRTIKWEPSRVLWADYSTSPVTVHCRLAANLTREALPVTAFEEMPSIGLARRHRLRGVILQIRDKAEGAGSSSARRAARFQAFGYPTAGIAMGERGVVSFTLDDVDSFSQVDSNLAKAIFDSYNAIQWGGAGRLKGPGVPTIAPVGRMIDVTGGRTAWATMGAVIQRTIDDFGAGTRGVEFGTPGRLGAKDLIDLMSANRFRFIPGKNAEDMQKDGEADGQSWGFDGSKDDGGTAPSDPDYGPIQIKAIVASGSGTAATTIELNGKVV